MSVQLGMFDVLEVYDDGVIDNDTLYDRLQSRFGISKEDLLATRPVGKDGIPVSPAKRRVRWMQQSLKARGLLERVSYGQWRRTGKKKEFTQLILNKVLLAYSTDLNCALLGDHDDVIHQIDQPIHLYFTSPPYPLQVPRNYGNVDVREYVDWLCARLAPVVDRLAPGGSIMLNISNDIFQHQSPARSTYQERLVIALEDRFGLQKMDMIPWTSNKAPGPIQWTQRRTCQNHVGWEPLYWFCREPHLVYSDHRRLTGGQGLSRNIWEVNNYCPENRAVHRAADALGLPRHPATMPVALARRAIEFLTEPGQTVVDAFSGINTTGWSAESIGREAIVGETMAQFCMLGASRWTDAGMPINIHPDLARLCA